MSIDIEGRLCLNPKVLTNMLESFGLQYELACELASFICINHLPPLVAAPMRTFHFSRNSCIGDFCS